MTDSHGYIRNIAVSARSDVILYQKKDTVVHMTTVFGKDTREIINCPAEWVMMRVSGDGKYAVIACPDANWLSFHDLEHGIVLFAKKLRGKIQQIGLLENQGPYPYVVFERGRLEVFDESGVGRRLRTAPRLEYFYPSPTSPFAFEVHYDQYMLSEAVDGGMAKVFAMEKQSFDCFPPVFWGDFFAFSEVKGSVQVYSTLTKEIVGVYNPRQGSHVTEMAYHGGLKSLVGIDHDYDNKGGGQKIVRIDYDNDTHECLRPGTFFRTESGFAKNGTLFVTAAYEVFTVPGTDKATEWL